jgi:hypothetical protein
MPRTVLHIGAHKTASSYIQKKLASNRDLLARHRIHYDGPMHFRENFTSQLRLIGGPRGAYVDGMVKRIKTQDVILSDEDLNGIPWEVMKRGKLYGRLNERLGLVRTSLEMVAPEVFLALRDYSQFAVSLYIEIIRHRDFLSFETFFKAFCDSNFSWLAVIEDVFSAVPDATLHVWDFGRFAVDEKPVFDALIGMDSSILEPLEGPARESFSATTVKALQALSAVLKPDDLRKIMPSIARKFPKGQEYGVYNPIPSDVAQKMRNAYLADLKKISERFPQVRFIT